MLFAFYGSTSERAGQLLFAKLSFVGLKLGLTHPGMVTAQESDNTPELHVIGIIEFVLDQFPSDAKIWCIC